MSTNSSERFKDNRPSLTLDDNDLILTQRSIDSAIAYYERGLQSRPDLLSRYHQQFTNDGTNDSLKINVICWLWAEQGRHDDAASLRSLDYIRTLQRHMVYGVRDFEETVALDTHRDAEFWNNVDRHLYNGFDLISRQHGDQGMVDYDLIAGAARTNLGQYNNLDLTRERLTPAGFENAQIIYRLQYSA